MPLRIDDPFDTIESAHSFLTLLHQAVAETKRELEMDVERSTDSNISRRLETLRVATYNLEKLEFHLTRSSRILNDLRSLRRLLFQERGEKISDGDTEVMISSPASSNDPSDRRDY